MRFFEPSDRFIRWLAKYADGRVTIDCGCGEGHVLKALREAGVKAMGIDPEIDPERNFKYGLTSAIFPGYAQECKLVRRPNVLALFCRPCHSGFVGETFDVLHESSEALYISKPSNLLLDLGDFETEEVESPPCKKERVYRIVRRIRESPKSHYATLNDLQDVIGDLYNLRRRLNKAQEVFK